MRGHVHRDFEAVASALRLSVPRAGPGGAAVAVYHRGEKVVDLALGTRDRAESPFEPDTLAISMSTTKGVTATALHVLVDRGEVSLDAPVARYWPEFAARGKGAITVRHALAHQAGLYLVAPLVERFEDLYDWDAMQRRLADAEPAHAPGAASGYHAFTYGWLIGEIVRRVAGTPTFSEALAELVARPLGLDGLFVGVPEGELARVAEIVGVSRLPELSRRGARVGRRLVGGALRALGAPTDVDDAAGALFPPGITRVDLGSRELRRAELPAVNGHFDARSLAKLYAALAGGGSIDGARLLSRATIEEARRDQSGYFSLCRVIPFPLRMKLGYHRAISLGVRVPALGTTLDVGVASPASFGHFGFGGSGGWADPERELSVGLVTNTFFGRLPMDLRAVAVATAAAWAADRR
ncbi:MAG: beta-lactamase family protein [Polyangiaceae bacterium]|nr:beta-lactamase family protein [Polyangiaceae bacterium]